MSPFLILKSVFLRPVTLYHVCFRIGERARKWNYWLTLCKEQAWLLPSVWSDSNCMHVLFNFERRYIINSKIGRDWWKRAEYSAATKGFELNYGMNNVMLSNLITVQPEVHEQCKLRSYWTNYVAKMTDS